MAVLALTFTPRCRLFAPETGKRCRLFAHRRRRFVRATEGDEEDFRVPIAENSDEPQGETVADKLERYRQESIQAESRAARQLGSEYSTDNWEGDVYVGSNWNVLTVILIISIAVPLAGLVFAYFTYGTLWGVDSQAI